MADLFSALFDYITGGFTWLLRLVGQLFSDVGEALTDAFVWVFDELLGLAVSAVLSIDTGSIGGGIAALGAIPSEMLPVLSALGLGTAMGIIGSALAIRFALQLIPFVRLGS